MVMKGVIFKYNKKSNIWENPFLYEIAQVDIVSKKITKQLGIMPWTLTIISVLNHAKKSGTAEVLFKHQIVFFFSS